jgi:glycosyltransferase involved in cell wall biosynthesis
MKIMVCNFARGGMRSVVEAYTRDGFVRSQHIELIYSYVDGGFARRQATLCASFIQFLWLLVWHEVELVHCHVAMRGSFWRKSLFAVAARAAGAKVILHLHGSEMKNFFGNQPKWIQRIIGAQFERADGVIVLSESWRTFIFEIAPHANPIVMPNYIPVLPLETKLHDKKRVDILFLGMIGKRKGIFDLLEAIGQLRSVCPEIHLTVGGDGQLEEARKLAADLLISDCVTFLGWIDGVIKARLLQQADIFALPSYNEGLPVSLLEAMSNGVAVITTDVGGIPELIRPDIEGVMIKAGDIEALTAGLRRLATDIRFRQSTAAAAYDRVKLCYSKDVLLPRLENIYAMLLSTPPGQRSHAVSR